MDIFIEVRTTAFNSSASLFPVCVCLCVNTLDRTIWMKWLASYGEIEYNNTISKRKLIIYFPGKHGSGDKAFVWLSINCLLISWKYVKEVTTYLWPAHWEIMLGHFWIFSLVISRSFQWILKYVGLLANHHLRTRKL